MASVLPFCCSLLNCCPAQCNARTVDVVHRQALLSPSSWPPGCSFSGVGEHRMEFAAYPNHKAIWKDGVGNVTIYASTLPETQESEAGVATSQEEVAFPCAQSESPRGRVSPPLELA